MCAPLPTYQELRVKLLHLQQHPLPGNCQLEMQILKPSPVPSQSETGWNRCFWYTLRIVVCVYVCFFILSYHEYINFLPFKTFLLWNFNAKIHSIVWMNPRIVTCAICLFCPYEPFHISCKHDTSFLIFQRTLSCHSTIITSKKINNNFQASYCPYQDFPIIPFMSFKAL